MYHVTSIFDSGDTSDISDAQSMAQSHPPTQVYMTGTGTPSNNRQRKEPLEYLLEVTMPDRVKKLTITQEMAIRALKHMDE